MKTKKLHGIIFVLFLSMVCFTNVTKAATYYYIHTASGITDKLNWWTGGGVCGSATGTHPTFSGTANVYNFCTTGTYTLNGTWKIGSNATVNVGFGGTAVTLLTNGNNITHFGATNPTLSVLAVGTVNVSSTNFFNSSNLNLSAASGSLVDYTLSGATIGSVTYDNLTISANTTLNGNFVTVNNVFSNPSSILTMAGGTLIWSGTTSGSGTIKGDASGASISFDGGSAATLSMDQTTPGTTNIMSSVQTNGVGTLSFGNPLQIAAGGDITPITGTIDVSTGSVVLLADQVTVGITACIGSVGGTFTGNISSQIFHNPSGNKTDWTMMGSPGIKGQNFTQWNSVFPITCASCPDGYSPGGTNFGSITSYVEASDTYPEISNTTDAMTIGQGWWVYMGNSAPGTATSGELITVSGPPQIGSFSKTVSTGGTGAGYNLIANPYPSPISWTTFQANNINIDVSYYTWSPNQAAHSSFNATTGLSSPLSGSYALSDIIPTGMGIYVLVNSGTSVAFAETDKLQGTQVLLKQSNNNSIQSKTPAFSLQASGNGMIHETVFGFVPTATIGYDINEDTKIFGSTAGQLTLSSFVGGFDLTINCLPNLTQNYSMPVKMKTGTTGTYSISAANLERMPSGACLILHDNYTNNNYDLRTGPYSITLTDTENVARFVLNITNAPATMTGNAFQATCPSSNDGYITAMGTNSGPWNYTWKNSNSVIVKSSSNKASADTLNGLGAGVYSVDVNTVGTCDNATQSFTITIAAPSSLAISTNSTQASCSTAYDGFITVVGNNAGPWNYTWKDGSNNILQITNNKATADTLNGLNGGVYSVEVNTAGTCDLATQSFTLAVPASPTSAFSTASATVTVSTVVAFTNSSTNASNFWWTFGDGSTSNLQNPNYTYNTLGTYTVTLYAFNAGCNDTVTSQQIIIVQATTGIAMFATSDITVSKDQNGAYVKFNYPGQTKVNINVYNSLGQVLLSNANLAVVNDKIYLNLDNAKDQLIFISIGNLDKNTQVTKKLFNN